MGAILMGCALCHSDQLWLGCGGLRDSVLCDGLAALLMGEEWDHTPSLLECLSLSLSLEPPQDSDQFVRLIHPSCLPGLRLRDFPRLETPAHLDEHPMPVDVSQPGPRQFAKPHPRSECRHPEGIAVRTPSQTDGCVRKQKPHPLRGSISERIASLHECG